MRPVVMVSSVVPVLIALSACCSAKPVSETLEFRVTEADLEAVLVDGELTAAGCEQLCRDEASLQRIDVTEVSSCERSGDVTSTPVTDTGGVSTGDTAAGGIPFTCSVSGTAECMGGRDHACADRRHEGIATSRFGAWLGAQAHAEASSVRAFVVIAGELRRFGAPEDLVARSMEAARDEVAHARILNRLAAARGGAAAALSFPAAEERSLLAFAVENAVEGCVRETWAALVAAWQAEHAETVEVRAAFARIARDEARHGDLAWAIDAWLAERLSAEELAEVRRARRDAIDQLLAGLGEPEEEVARGAGLPSAERARSLLAGLDEALFRAAA